MNWLKDVGVDIAILILVAVFSVIQNDILYIALWVYTGLLLAGKLISYFMRSLNRRSMKTNAPDWFYHVNYLLITVIFLYTQTYYISAAWFLIWLISFVNSKRAN